LFALANEQTGQFMSSVTNLLESVMPEVLRWLVITIIAANFSGCADMARRNTQLQLPMNDPALAPVTSTRLDRFRDEAEFQAYLSTLESIVARRRSAWSRPPAPGAMARYQEEECTPEQDCEKSDSLEAVAVTGSRVARASTAPTSITNNQSVGVDEGDVVKQIGDYLLVLQDGRVFAVRIGSADKHERLALTDRINVYREGEKSDASAVTYWHSKFDGADWYDEMLVYSNYIVLTAYDYREQATEVSVIELTQATGELTLRSVVLIPSYDYYSSTNYATRIVGDQLVIRTTLDLGEKPFFWPSLRTAYPKASGVMSVRPLLQANQVYKPVLRTAEPVLSQITRCSLAQLATRSTPECTAIGLLGPYGSEFYLSPDYTYIWNTAGDWDFYDQTCESLGQSVHRRTATRNVPLAAVYRISNTNGEVTLAAARGYLADQFNVDEFQSRLRALVVWRPGGCYFDGDYSDSDEDTHLSFLSLNAEDFGNTFRLLDERRFTVVPSVSGSSLSTRFIDRWLVYGATQSWYDDTLTPGGEVVTLREDRPDEAKILPLHHNVTRMERLDAGAYVSGYRDDSGLYVSALKFGRRAAVLDTIKLDERIESEGRSHAFNYTVGPGGITMGIPTVRISTNEPYYAEDEGSDLSFMTLIDGRLTSIGALPAVDRKTAPPNPDYVCEVSCIDWYGNTRPIFTQGRIFGLMATQLVEAQARDGAMVVLQRVDLMQSGISSTGFE
jgi:hypothetical protein